MVDATLLMVNSIPIMYRTINCLRRRPIERFPLVISPSSIFMSPFPNVYVCPAYKINAVFLRRTSSGRPAVPHLGCCFPISCHPHEYVRHEKSAVCVCVTST